jgi:predicted nucleic acid-binding OB-fold protein
MFKHNQKVIHNKDEKVLNNLNKFNNVEIRLHQLILIPVEILKR